MPAKVINIENARVARRVAVRNELAEQHLHLVPPIARAIARRLPMEFELDDLMAHGYEGLVDASRKFKPGLGVPFTKYAKMRIRGEIHAHLRRRVYRDRVTNVEIAPDSLFGAEDWSEPGGHDRGIADTRRRRIVVAAADVEAETARRETIATVRKALALVPPRTRHVLLLHYYGERILADVGAAVPNVAAGGTGVNESRASQLHREGLKQLEDRLRSFGIRRAA